MEIQEEYSDTMSSGSNDIFSLNRHRNDTNWFRSVFKDMFVSSSTSPTPLPPSSLSSPPPTTTTTTMSSSLLTPPPPPPYDDNTHNSANKNTITNNNKSNYNNNDDDNDDSSNSIINCNSSYTGTFDTSGNDNDNDTKEALDAQTMLAREMNKLSVEEREKVFQDIHCVPNITYESHILINQSLEKLEYELNIIKDRKIGYNLAKSISYDYVTNIKFRITFLRSENFNCKLAAKRIITFFDLKLDLFGSKTLVRDISILDFDNDTKIVLESGLLQLLSNDQAGRGIIGLFPDLKRHKYAKSFQQIGLVGINFFMNPLQIERSLVRKMANLRQSCPIKFVCCHVCYNYALFRPMLNLGMLLTNRTGRVRFRAHYGSVIDCRYKLSTFGIRLSSFPVLCDGTYQLHNHHTWVQKQYNELSLSSSTTIPTMSSPMHDDNEEEDNIEQQLVIEDRLKFNPLIDDGREKDDHPFQEEDVMDMKLEQRHLDGILSPSPSPSPMPPVIRLSPEPSSSPEPPNSPALTTTTENNNNSNKDIKINGTSNNNNKSNNNTNNNHIIIIKQPKSNDVLFGRGRPIQRHPANIQLRKLISSHQMIYDNAKRREKPKIASMIVELMKDEKSSRFLKQEKDGSWIEVNDEEARIKVCHDFRNKRLADKRNNQNKKQQQKEEQQQPTKRKKAKAIKTKQQKDGNKIGGGRGGAGAGPGCSKLQRRPIK